MSREADGLVQVLSRVIALLERIDARLDLVTAKLAELEERATRTEDDVRGIGDAILSDRLPPEE